MISVLAVLATIAGIIMSVGYFPQAIKIIKKKSAKEISLTTYLIFSVGILIWLFYGISINDFPLIFANVLALIGCALVLIAYFIYRK